MEHIFAVECLRHIPNPYDLVLSAAARARELRRGAEPRIPLDRRAAATAALSEIAAGAFTPAELTQLLLPKPPAGDDDSPEVATMPDEHALLEGLTASAAFEPPRDEATERLN